MTNGRHWSNELLDGPFDFEANDELLTDPDVMTYPRDAQEAEQRWQKRLKYDLLILKADKKEGQEAREKLKRRYGQLRQADAPDGRRRAAGDVPNGADHAFDPHTNYMSPSTLENFDIIMRLKLEGIGAALQIGGRLHDRVRRSFPAARPTRTAA